MDEAPQRLGRYELLARLATGGMGEIYLARLSGRAGFEKLVVLKRLLPELRPSREYLEMFLDEARLAARLSHPNVCEVHDLGEEDGHVYIVMQYLDGVPFAALMRRPPEVTPREQIRLVAGVLVQACEGLHHAHELAGADGAPLGVVHRDVSPSNLMVTADGVVKVLDFGIAKAQTGTAVTERGVLKGKVAYMAPEQLAERPVDRRADLFCLGILAWEGIAGEPLFPRDSAIATARAVLEAPLPSLLQHAPDTPPGLVAVVERALERDPARRFASARELGAALAEATAPLGGPMTPPELAEALRARCAERLGTQRAAHERTLRSVTPAAAPPPETSVTVAASPAALHGRPRPPARGRPAIWPLFVGAAVVIGMAVALTRWSASTGGPAPADAAPAVSTTPEPRPDPRSDPRSDPPPDPQPDPQPAADPQPSRPRPRPQPPASPKAPVEDGFVSIDSTPFATIYIDDRKLGVTPLIRVALAPGRHRVRAVLEDGRKRDLTVTIEPGRVAPPVTLTW